MSKELISTPRQSPPVNITKIFLATTNLHFMQHEFCSRVYLFSITGEFTFRKECITNDAKAEYPATNYE
ncbi:hypothetical protein GCM10027435_30710 [Haloparvum alkalitolerans]